jgi:hypothetical protein
VTLKHASFGKNNVFDFYLFLNFIFILKKVLQFLFSWSLNSGPHVCWAGSLCLSYTTSCFQFLKISCQAGGIAQAVECQPCRPEALSGKSNIAINK